MTPVNELWWLEKQNKLTALYNSFGKVELFNWLEGRSFSDAFVICLGAGPWKFKRRQAVQKKALEHLNGSDLSKIGTSNHWYPFGWQNKMLNSMSKFLSDSSKTMNSFCEDLILLGKTAPNHSAFIAQRVLCAACDIGEKPLPKVLSLFCRDSLRIESFPIDRHVKKFLLEHSFPADEQAMIKICNRAKLDPIYVATGIIKIAGNLDNPDWNLK